MKVMVTAGALILLLSVTAAGQGRGNHPPTGLYTIRGRLVFSTGKLPEDRIQVVLERNLQRVSATFAETLGNFDVAGCSLQLSSSRSFNE